MRGALTAATSPPSISVTVSMGRGPPPPAGSTTNLGTLPSREGPRSATGVTSARRETLELLRDPIRLAMSLAGTALLMLIMGYGISLDVEDLTFAVLDRDQSTLSQGYTQGLSGSRYFIEQAPLRSNLDGPAAS